MIAGLYKCFDHWHKQGTVFIYSDTHFNDAELEAGHPRPYSSEEHLKRINSKVGKKDTLILLGDVGDIELAKRLKGYKILICGNHDAGRTSYERRVITQLFSKDLYTKEQVLDLMKTMYPNCRYSIEERRQLGSFFEASADNGLFDEVYEGPLMIGEKFILSHEPLDVPWAFNFHGHDHAGTKRQRHLNCCADVVGYEPINLNQFMKTGPAAKIDSLHRCTIDKATERKKKHGGKRNG